MGEHDGIDGGIQDGRLYGKNIFSYEISKTILHSHSLRQTLLLC